MTIKVLILIYFYLNWQYSTNIKTQIILAIKASKRGFNGYKDWCFNSFNFSYATKADLCFNQLMLLHITWTGFVISILGFEITTTSDIIEAIRFIMHLAGWLIMLFIVCYYGQNLLDEVFAFENIYTNLYTINFFRVMLLALLFTTINGITFLLIFKNMLS